MASGSRSFNFGSDDVLCSYDDFAAQDSSSTGTKRSDLSAKDFPDGRMARPLVNIYEQEDHSKEDLVSTVEKCMKKYADTLMRSLDGITGRLSQLEIHCYKLERSIGELRGDMVQGQNEADLKFKSLEKHMQEVHRAVQILRDKQELAETQKELAKLQTIQKESSPPDERAPSPHPEPAKHDDGPQLSNNQLALVPSCPQAVQPQQQQHLALPQAQLAQLPVQQDQYTVSQPTTYFSVSQAQAQQLPPGYHFVQVTPAQPPQAPVQPPQQQAAPPPQQVTPPQVSHVVNAMPQQPAPQFSQQWAAQQPNLNPNQQQFTSQGVPPSQAAPPSQPVPPQQWAPQQPNPNPNQQQFTSQGVPPSQAAPPSQAVPPSGAPQRPHPPPGYGSQFQPYPPPQPSNPISETYAVSMPIPTPYSTAPQPGMNRSDMAPAGYGSQGNTRQPISNQGSFMAAPQIGKGGYTNVPPYMQGNLPGYNSGPYNYPPSNAPGAHLGSQQLPRNHPYGEFVEKAVGMGYPREQVTNVALKMVESGQAMDFNALLDRLNGVSSPSPRAWSG